MVGTSGIDAERLRAVVASARTFPPLICPTADPARSNSMVMRPPMMSGYTAPLPLKGTWVMSTPARSLKISPDRWLLVPGPEEPKNSPPGLDLAAAIRSETVLNGLSAATTRRFGTVAIPATTARSLRGSQLSFIRLTLVDTDSEPSSRVWPSARACFATYSAPMLPPAPGRSSTSTFWFSDLVSSFANSRASTSAVPPAANGTMMLIGREGKPGWASAGDSGSARAQARSAQRAVLRAWAAVRVGVMGGPGQGWRKSGEEAGRPHRGRRQRRAQCDGCDIEARRMPSVIGGGERFSVARRYDHPRP